MKRIAASGRFPQRAIEMITPKQQIEPMPRTEVTFFPDSTVVDALLVMAHLGVRRYSVHFTFMNITGFTQEQKQALLDLLIIGMYADHDLASAEDARIDELLAAFQFRSDYERQMFSDAAFTRVSRESTSPDKIRASVTQLAGQFPTREIRRRAYDILDDLITSDGRVSSEESQLLSVTKELFQL